MFPLISAPHRRSQSRRQIAADPERAAAHSRGRQANTRCSLRRRTSPQRRWRSTRSPYSKPSAHYSEIWKKSKKEKECKQRPVCVSQRQTLTTKWASCKEIDSDVYFSKSIPAWAVSFIWLSSVAICRQLTKGKFGTVEQEKLKLWKWQEHF